MLKPIYVHIILFIFSPLALADNSLYLETLPKVMCQDDQYFMACFSDAHKYCERDFVTFAKKCLNEKEPELRKLASTMTGERLRMATDIKIGFCIGKEYDKKNASNKKDEPKCYQNSKW